MFFRLQIAFLLLIAGLTIGSSTAAETLNPVHLRCEYRENPLGIDAVTPRLSWKVESTVRGDRQTGYRLLVASSPEPLAADSGDLWDSGKVVTDQTLFIRYGGQPLRSRQTCHWKVKVWDQDGKESSWSDPAIWSMGLTETSDWSADYISFQDDSPVATDTTRLTLPAAKQYRKSFDAPKEVKRATIYATALGIYELHLNGQRVGDAYFAPGWTDYCQRAYYSTYDVTDRVQRGANAIGAWVADGWYSGYVGFGLLTGIGTEKTGRATYGKTPAVMAQLEIEYTDGSRDVIGTDATWKVTDAGPIQEADLLMGEAYDARRELHGWATADFDDESWSAAILAIGNGPQPATFFQFKNPEAAGQPVGKVATPIDLGFHRPKLEAFPGVPVRITEEIKAKSVTPREPGTYVIDLGQNFAGVIRLKLKGPAGQRVRIRYAEMLHPDGRVMTENLRKARATDHYTCSGDPEGEIYQPRFTFHGFQYVELSNFPGDPDLATVTGLVMHSDTPMVSTFVCSDPMVNRLYQNVLWTQRSNFLDLPTDCPQRDERMGWTGDAQAYVATAAYNADIGAFYTKWLRELMESQRPSGAFPGYAPYPFQHGLDFGTAWADAGVICPWTLWQAYGDTDVIRNCWPEMTRFMDWRERTSVDGLGVSHGNAWGDWLAQGAQTPLDYVDTIYFAISSKMMSEMAHAIDDAAAAAHYRQMFEETRAAFQKKYVTPEGRISVATQTAQALALFANLVPESLRTATAEHLAAMLADNGNHMATGFLGTRPLLPVLSSAGQHDLATFLLQSREFPSWGYEIANGATTIWERWDSYTKEDAFGRHNAAMNSFSHYAFGAVCEWMFATLAGIRSDGPGYQKIVIQPTPPTPGSNGNHEAIHSVRATYDSIRGLIVSDWKLVDGRFSLTTSIPANTTAIVVIPTRDAASIIEGGRRLANHPNVRIIRVSDTQATMSVDSGSYHFESDSGIEAATQPLRTSKPKDNSINPEEIDLRKATPIQSWDFCNPTAAAQWSTERVKIVSREGKATLRATGDDSQISTVLAKPAKGTLALELKLHPAEPTTVQVFWAEPGTGFRATQQTKRALAESEQMNAYLFRIPTGTVIGKLRVDPFDTYDQYAAPGEMVIESVTLYQLSR